MTPDRTTNTQSAVAASGTGFAITSYSFNGQIFGDLCQKPIIPKTFQDGTSNTALLFERYAICGAGGDVRTWGDGAGRARTLNVPTSLTLQPSASPPVAGDSPPTPGTAWVDTYVTAVFQVQPLPSKCTSSTHDTSTPTRR